MANVPVYFEQRRVGTIEIDKAGPSFLYDPPLDRAARGIPHLGNDAAFGRAHLLPMFSCHGQPTCSLRASSCALWASF